MTDKYNLVDRFERSHLGKEVCVTTKPNVHQVYARLEGRLRLGTRGFPFQVDLLHNGGFDVPAIAGPIWNYYVKETQDE